MKAVTGKALRKCQEGGVILLVWDVSVWFVWQLLRMTDVTGTRIAPAALPTPTAASGATTRSAFLQTVTAAW